MHAPAPHSRNPSGGSWWRTPPPVARDPPSPAFSPHFDGQRGSCSCHSTPATRCTTPSSAPCPASAGSSPGSTRPPSGSSPHVPARPRATRCSPHWPSSHSSTPSASRRRSGCRRRTSAGMTGSGAASASSAARTAPASHASSGSPSTPRRCLGHVSSAQSPHHPDPSPRCPPPTSTAGCAPASPAAETPTALGTRCGGVSRRSCGTRGCPSRTSCGRAAGSQPRSVASTSTRGSTEGTFVTAGARRAARGRGAGRGRWRRAADGGGRMAAAGPALTIGVRREGRRRWIARDRRRRTPPRAARRSPRVRSWCVHDLS
eukprot:gene12982-biopygen23014